MNFFSVCYFRTHPFRIPHLVPFTALLLEHLPMKKLHKKMDIFWSMLPLSELNAPKNQTVSFHFHFRLWPFLWLRECLAANEKNSSTEWAWALKFYVLMELCISSFPFEKTECFGRGKVISFLSITKIRCDFYSDYSLLLKIHVQMVNGTKIH